MPSPECPPAICEATERENLLRVFVTRLDDGVATVPSKAEWRPPRPREPCAIGSLLPGLPSESAT
jgi:hypothetical protein